MRNEPGFNENTPPESSGSELAIRKEFSRPEVEEMIEPLEEILHNIGRSFEKGEYDMIIGDDASGRLPAMALWRAADKIARWKNLMPPEIKFIAGSRSPYEYGLKKFQEEKKKLIADYIRTFSKEKKKLIVTEYIRKGDGMVPLAQALEENGFDFDIATLTMDGEMSESFLEKKLHCEIFTGSYTGGITPKIYRTYLSGVTKKAQELHARRIVTPDLKRQSDMQVAHSESYAVGDKIAKDYMQHREG